ncbi:Spo0B domain-containing protein [Paenisporosarcina sp. TG20]|uniref:Spo0B domain-containing protein n=1 Tax=Paenisporosarcina sp. TG20 TaxID=1211706 RepID=UPI0002D834EA|nr:Spo0B domain-containing protein [Paenisporosarcina sp. TG20]
MNTKPLSVNDALRFARHDFLNQLQLVKMNIDLGQLEDAKTVIDRYTTEVKAFYELTKLNIPYTSEWLQTANWRFLGFQVNITSQIESTCNPLLDHPIYQLLEQTTKLLHEKLNPYSEQQLHVHIVCNPTEFRITVEANGEWEPIQQEIIYEQSLITLTYEYKTTKKWRFHIEESKEE